MSHQKSVGRSRKAQDSKPRSNPRQAVKGARASAGPVTAGSVAGSLISFRDSLSREAIWIGLALVALNVAVYAPVRHYGFVDYDDGLYLRDNSIVTRGLTWHGVGWAFTSGRATNWHPVTWLSHMLDVQLFGLNAGGHHLTSLALHIGSTVLLFAAFNWMTASLGKSAFVAALFAVHPLHVESVAWVAERKDVLSTFFGALSICAYVAYVRRPGWTRYLIVILLYALGLLAKPMLVTLPFVFLLLDVWPLGRLPLSHSGIAALPRLIREKLPLMALAGASSVVTFAVQRSGGAMSNLDAFPLPLRVANALVAYATYIEKTLWPSGLAPFYPYPRTFGLWSVAGCLALIVAVTALVLRAAPRSPYLAVGWFWYLGTLVPVIGLVQVGMQSMADRYSYVPMVGLLVMVAWGVPPIVHLDRARRTSLATVACALVIGCAIAARHQLQYWGDYLGPWRRAASVTSGAYMAEYNLAAGLEEEGKSGEALVHYSRAVELNPDYAPAHNNFGVVLGNTGRTEDAIRQFADAIRLRPDNADYRYNVAVLLARSGRSAEAVTHLKLALQSNPQHPGARRLLDVLASERQASLP